MINKFISFFVSVPLHLLLVSFHSTPLCAQALVRERIDDWITKFAQKLNKNVVELTGDNTPDIAAIERAHIIVTTPEKWDGISRSWQQRSYVKVFT